MILPSAILGPVGLAALAGAQEAKTPLFAVSCVSGLLIFAFFSFCVFVKVTPWADPLGRPSIGTCSGCFPNSFPTSLAG